MAKYNPLKKVSQAMSNCYNLVSLMGWLACFIACQFPVAAQETAPSTRLPRPLTLSDLAPHPHGSKTYSEFWTYQFAFQNGVQLQLNLSRANLGSLKDPICGADLAVMGFNGKNFMVAREYPKKNFSFDASKARLNVHQKIGFEGDPADSHHVFFATKKGDVDYFLDLLIEKGEPGATLGNGQWNLANGNEVGLYVHIPNGKVTGKIAINGDTLVVSGMAWMDHSWQTDFATKIMNSSYRFIRFGETNTPGFGAVYTETHGNPDHFGLVYQGGGSDFANTWFSPQSLVTTNFKKQLGVKWPQTLRLQAGEKTYDVETENAKQGISTLNEFSGMTKWGIKRFMGGEMMGFRGKLKGPGLSVFSFVVVDP